MKEATGLDTAKYVVFKLSNEDYGIGIQWVYTIEKTMKVTRVPKAPKCIKGVVNLRGEIVPVMSLRERFNLEKSEETEETRIVIVKAGEFQVGIIVDIVEEVVQLNEEMIENVANLGGDISMDYILGVGKADDKVITLLNVEKLLDISEKE